MNEIASSKNSWLERLESSAERDNKHSLYYQHEFLLFYWVLIWITYLLTTHKIRIQFYFDARAQRKLQSSSQLTNKNHTVSSTRRFSERHHDYDSKIFLLVLDNYHILNQRRALHHVYSTERNLHVIRASMGKVFRSQRDYFWPSLRYNWVITQLANVEAAKSLHNGQLVKNKSALPPFKNC